MIVLHAETIWECRFKTIQARLIQKAWCLWLPLVATIIKALSAARKLGTRCIEQGTQRLYLAA